MYLYRNPILSFKFDENWDTLSCYLRVLRLFITTARYSTQVRVYKFSKPEIINDFSLTFAVLDILTAISYVQKPHL